MKTQTNQLTLDVPLRPPRGKRKRGRPKGRTTVAHERREEFAGRFVEHVTLRVRREVGRIRRRRVLEVVKRAIRLGGHKDDFRVVHYNLLSNHLHLIVEADGKQALSRGMQGLEVRLARRINRVLDRRGKFFAERYHSRVLRTPSEVRAAVRYVLLNARHHSPRPPTPNWVDPFSSGAWFDGWRDPIRADEPWMKELMAERPPTATPTRWLLKEGWRRGGGPIRFDEVPGQV